jgi:competence CoiA-like predicted nuclease
MENGFYRGKVICTFDLKDENGLYYEDMVLEWKQAAADRMLTCLDCGAHVYLAAGPVKEPYFAHYDLENCDYGNGHESEELKKGKRLLYRLLKRSFPGSDVQARYRMENGMYSTLCCAIKNNKDNKLIAIDYRLQNNSLDKFRLRVTFYQSHHILPFYILGIRQEKDTKQIDWYQSLLQFSMGYLAFLDTEQEAMTLKKSFGYRLGKNRKFLYCIKSYPIQELLVDPEGRIICNFMEECNKIELQIKEEKLQYQRMQEKLTERKEEKRRLDEKEAQRLEAYRRAKEQEEKDCLGDRKTIEQSELLGLNPIILEKCKKMIEEGNAHLVSKKYYDAIMKHQ